ncbi:MAG: ribonuclease E/G [Rhodothalassiaceae bacterium]
MTIELLIDDGIGELRTALLFAGEVREIRLYRPQRPALEAVYLARLTDRLPGHDGAFVNLGDDGDAFVPRAREKGRTGGEAAATGAIFPVQIRSLPREGDKLARASRVIRLRGRYLDLIRPGAGLDDGGPDIGAPRRQKLTDALASGLAQHRLVLRPAAAAAGDEAIIAEASRLQGQIRALAAAGGGPRLVLPPPDALARAIRDAPPSLARIRIAQRHLVPALEPLARVWPDVAGKAVLWREKTPLFEALGVEPILAALIAGCIRLPSGGRLWLDDTHAGTMIDIDTGAAGPTAKTAQRQANEEAAVAVARLLRLADIGGLVVVDFIDPGGARARARLLDRLDQALADDPAPVRRSGLSGDGILSLTRRREGPGLRDLLLAPRQNRLSCESRALALLREAAALAGRETQPGCLVLTATRDVIAWIRTAGHDTALATRTGRAVRLDAAPAPADIGESARIDPE